MCVLDVGATAQPDPFSRMTLLQADKQKRPAFICCRAAKRSALAAVVIAILPAAYPGVARAQPYRAGSLCQGPETVLFACQVGTKLVSVCGQGPGQAAYRYGRPSRVELELTELWSAEHAFSGGGETQVYARTPTHTYVVYDRTVRTSFADGRHDPAERSGIVVQAGGQTIAAQRCQQPPTVSPLLQSAIPGGDYIPH